MMLAWYLHREPLPPRFHVVLIAGGMIAIPTGLILLQPDFGTGMLVAVSGVFVLFLAGLQWWWIGAAVAGVAAAAPAAWFWWLKPYQKDRILTFLNPESDPLGTGWNIIQSKIAVGSGGWLGKGWGQGTQSRQARQPWPQPTPVQPPEPIAILDWMMFQPAPSGSDSDPGR